MGLFAQATVAGAGAPRNAIWLCGHGIIVGTVIARQPDQSRDEIQKDIEDILSHDGTAVRIGGGFSARC